MNGDFPSQFSFNLATIDRFLCCTKSTDWTTIFPTFLLQYQPCNHCFLCCTKSHRVIGDFPHISLSTLTLQPSFPLLHKVPQSERRFFPHFSLDKVERKSFLVGQHGEEAIFRHGAVQTVVKRNLLLCSDLRTRRGKILSIDPIKSKSGTFSTPYTNILDEWLSSYLASIQSAPRPHMIHPISYSWSVWTMICCNTSLVLTDNI